MLSLLVQTLGCKLNLLESEALTDAFIKAGFSIYDTESKSSPSVILINTCTVTSKADQKARRVIRKALRDNPASCVLVTGCYAQLNQAEIKKLEENQNGRFFVLKGMDKKNILNFPRFFDSAGSLSASFKKWHESSLKEKGDKTDVFQFSPKRFSTHTRSFLKIQDGCDNHCTYCRVRLARGHSISLDAEQVLERLRILEESHAEAVLTGVNISQYCDKSHGNLGGLLAYLLSGTSKIALRLSSLAPESVDENLAKILKDKRIRPHFHLSIQSGSKKILEKMGRSYNAQIVEKAVSLLRNAKDDPFLACDIITGFPGETETEFNETFDLCRKIGFAWIHVFPFSKREGTPAWSFLDAVNEKEINNRVRLLTDLAWSGRADYINRWLGREADILIEKKNSKNLYCRGISENYLKVLVYYNEDNAPLPGTILRCRLGRNENNVKKDYDAEVNVDK